MNEMFDQVHFQLRFDVKVPDETEYFDLLVSKVRNAAPELGMKESEDKSLKDQDGKVTGRSFFSNDQSLSVSANIVKPGDVYVNIGLLKVEDMSRDGFQETVDEILACFPRKNSAIHDEVEVDVRGVYTSSNKDIQKAQSNYTPIIKQLRPRDPIGNESSDFDVSFEMTYLKEFNKKIDYDLLNYKEEGKPTLFAIGINILCSRRQDKAASIKGVKDMLESLDVFGQLESEADYLEKLLNLGQ